MARNGAVFGRAGSNAKGFGAIYSLVLMLAGPLFKVVAVFCLVLQVWVGCAPAGVRFCARAIDQRQCCCEPTATKACCCCEGEASQPGPSRPGELNDHRGCCIGLPALPGPMNVQARVDQVDALRLVALPVDVGALIMPVVQSVLLSTWRAPPDPGRARDAQGLASTRLII